MTAKKSPLGDALFAMLTDMTQAQVRIYRRSDLPTGSQEQAADIAVRLVAARHRPLVLDAIKRPSRSEGAK